jgi:hypothetical protein
MAEKDRTSTQPKEAAVGQPPKDLFPVSDIRFVITEVTRLQTQQEFVQRDVAEARTDLRDVRDRIIKLEVIVTHLPSKGFIIAVVTTALVIAGALIAIAPKLQYLLYTPPVAVSPSAVAK